MTTIKEKITAMTKEALLANKAASMDGVKGTPKEKELKEAIKPKLTTLRSIEAAIHNKEIEKKAKLTEDEIVGVLKSAQKVRLAEKEALVNAGRDTEKLDVQLAKVKEIIANAEVKDRKLIGIAQKELKGKADGKLITQIVNEELNK